MIEKSDDSMGIFLNKKQRGGGTSASAPRPHGTSEASNTGKLIPVKRQPKNLKSSCPMMIEKVMIQLGVYFNRKGGAERNLRCRGCRKPRPKTNWESRGCEKPKPESRQKPQSQKASGTGNAEDAKERNCECRGCAMKGHKSHKNPRKSHKSQKAEKPPTLKNKNTS